jgi:hypothetical protein
LYASSCGHTVWDICLQRLSCWDWWFEFCWEHGCSSLVFVVCCVGSSFWEKVIVHSGESYHACVCVCLIVCYLETWTMERPRPKLDCCATEEKNILFFILFIT